MSDIDRGESQSPLYPIQAFASFLYIGHNAFQSGDVNHYGFLGHGKGLQEDSPYIDRIWDANIFWQIYSYNHHCVFLWVCRSGDELGGYTYPYEVNGMPFCWTHGSISSENGFTSPDYSGYSFISFENMSPMISAYLDPTISSLLHKHWLVYFYYALLQTGRTVNQALNYASQLCDYSSGFAQTKLCQGGDQYFPGSSALDPPYDEPIWVYSKMRIYGDGTMIVPKEIFYIYS
jgi:hypothetical protein